MNPRRLLRALAAVCLATLGAPAGRAAPPPEPGPGATALFDGRSLDGWEGAPGLWRVEDGAIVGGSLTRHIPQNEFLATLSRHTNFVLRLQFRLRGGAGFINSGVQIRSDRVPGSSEMAGYQCDIGDPTWWGSLYDESRRNRTVAWSDMTSLEPVLRRGGWNDYVIRADGARITTWINGVEAVDYFEPDAAIARVGGRIGFQVHGGGAAEAAFRRVTIESLPDRPAAEGAPEPPPAPHPSPLTPDEQAATFSVPSGFRVELVAAEPDGGKFVPIAFDHAGRLWTTTAFEYPVDGNESPAEARALFERGGRDRILVFDTPGAPGRQRAREFAGGLAIPLGVLPYRDGALVQYGSEVRWYRDTDADGRADRHEVLLSGFGIEDSHLFPHQFMRAPGNWFLLAQGAFNASQVRGADGGLTPFNKTKLARFRPDGSRFATIGWGPCNIWGTVLDRQGELFIQEANDQGWPVMPHLEGASYPLCGDDVPRPYAPPFPKTGGREMGGTGLSGLALSEGPDSFPAPWRDVFFVANPITRRIQAIRVHRGGVAGDPDRHGNGWVLEHLPDFLLSSDPWFRPIATAFGPDGCLYVVDWYNQIISHNEVPRTHPERDKTRGRIWRVRHESQPHRIHVPDLAQVPEPQLMESLAAPNTWEGQAAWQAMVDRGTRSLIPDLQRILSDPAAASDLRLRALWALEGLGGLDPAMLGRIFASASARALRREILRATRQSGVAAGTAAVLARDGLRDPDRLVRQEAIRAVGDLLDRNPDDPGSGERAGWLMTAGGESPAGDWSQAPRYFQDFERYLVRVILERHRTVALRRVSSPAGLTAEARMLGALGVGGAEGARAIAALLPELGRPLTTEELMVAAGAPDEPAVRRALRDALGRPATLAALHDQRGRLGDATRLAPLVVEAVRGLLRDQPGDISADLAVRLSSGFRLRDLEPEVASIAMAPGVPPARQLAALRALREVGSERIGVFRGLADSPDEAVRREAVAGLAALGSDAAVTALLELWPGIGPAARRTVVDRLASSPASAARLSRAIETGDVAREDLDGYTLDKLAAVLPGDPFVGRLVEEMRGALGTVLRLDGSDGARGDDVLALVGPFTVEAWIRLEAGISNADSLLGGPGLDINFFDGRLRVWLGPPHHDIVVAGRPMTAGVWTHVAVTRDADGIFRLYLNGEPDSTSRAGESRTLGGLRLGASNAGGGTAADLVEYRVWGVCRSADEIRAAANLFLDPGAPGLVFHGRGGSWGSLGPGARLEKTADLPPVQTEAEAAGMRARFDQFRALARRPGDPARGREVFAGLCGVCHAVAGQGGRIGPALDGAGAHGDEALLRNILTPGAAMEAGYRRFRIETVDGEVHEGLLAESDPTRLVLRQAGSEDRVFERGGVRRSGFLKGSVMPEGLLESLEPDRVPDLFAYLRTLGGGR